VIGSLYELSNCAEIGDLERPWTA